MNNDAIKKKHAEFDARIRAVLAEVRAKPNQTVIARLRQAVSSQLKRK